MVSGTTEGPAEDVVVEGNTVRDDRSPPWTEYGIMVRQATDAVVERNAVSGALEADYRIERTASGSFDVGRR